MKKHLPVCLIFLILLMTMTFPLFLKMQNYIPGSFFTDEPYAILWNSWRIKHSVLNNFALKHFPLIAYPFGEDIYNSGFISYLGLFWYHFLSILTTPAITYNIQTLLNVFLSGLFVYLLVFYLTGKMKIGLFSGTVFAFCPYQFARLWQHFGLTSNEWIPLALLGAISLKEGKNRWHSVLLLIGILLLFSFDYSVMYFGMVTLLGFLFYVFIYNWKKKLLGQKNLLSADLRYFRRAIMTGIIAFFLLLPQLYPVIKNRITLSSTTSPSVFNPYHRPFEDLFSQSARPLSYFLPAVAHPVFGRFTGRFIGSPLYGVSFTEHTLYLGWIPLGLALVAFRSWRRSRKRPAEAVSGRENFYVGFFIFLAALGWLFSQPPWWRIGPVKVFMPSFFMYKILPMFRAYCRFGIVLMLAVAVLAGYGLKFILEKFRTQKARILLTCLFSGLVLFEFWNWPPLKVIDVSESPRAYRWISEQPGEFALAEYPLDTDGPNEIYKFYQTFHHRPIINGTIPGTHANSVAKTIWRLSDLKTASVLSWMEVKYVLVHREDYLKTGLIEWIEELESISQNSGLKLVRSFAPEECPSGIPCVKQTGGIDVYEVIAEPVSPEDETAPSRH